MPLSREAIVKAALAIGDMEGLDAVSLRNVAAALDAGPMRLYGYLSTKDELLDLMADAVYGEMIAEGPLPQDWRDALRTVARRMRHAAQVHSWFATLLGGRPHQGPNALAYLEACLARLSATSGLADVDLILQAVKTVTAYVVGAVQDEARERRAEHESGFDKGSWQLATEAYIRRMIATGLFPNIAKVVEEARHPSGDVVFEQGLNWVLRGIEAETGVRGATAAETS